MSEVGHLSACCSGISKIGTFAQLGTALMSFSMGDVSAKGPFFTCRQRQ